MQRKLLWDPPILQDKITALSAAQRFQGMCEADGYWCSYEVFIDAPQEWADVTIRAVSRNMDLATELVRKRIDDIQNPLTGRAVVTTAGGRISGSLMRVTARPGAKFTVEALGDGIARGPAKFYIRASGPDSLPMDQNGRAVADPFAGRHQLVNFAGEVFAGVLVIPFLPAALLASNNARGNRICITDFLYTTNDVATAQIVTLQTRNATTAVVTPRRIWDTGRTNSQIQDTFTYALRGERGDAWELSINALGGTAHFNITGFVE